MREFLDQPRKVNDEVLDITEKVFKGEDSGIFNQAANNERSEIKPDDLHDLSEEAFKEINPLGLLIPDVKSRLESEIIELQNQINEIKNVYGESNEKSLREYKNQIISKNLWITKIDHYLLGINTEEIEKYKHNLN